jgi:uncharacterized protein (TIGR02598 family)
MIRLSLPSSKSKAADCRGFSLVEMTIAVGIFSFTILAILGSLPIGLSSIHDSIGDSAIANISQQIRSELQQVSFNSSNPASIQNFVNSSYYYSSEGDPTDASNAYYKAVISATNAVAGSTTYSPANAQMVTINLVYPQGIPSQNQKSSMVSILVAKQSSD